MRSHGITRPVLLFTALVPIPAGIFIPWLISRWHLQPAFLGIEPLRWVGAAMIPFGVAVYWSAVTCLGRQKASPYPPCTHIVSCDIYARTRNPMYTGVLLLMFGQAILFASRGVAIYAFCWFAAFHVFEVTYDEPFLARKFGAAYTDYHASVPRWIPRMTGERNSELRIRNEQ